MARKTDAAIETAVAEAPNQYVRIINLTKTQKQYPLTNGKWVSLGPWVARSSIHVSEPIKREFISPHIRGLEAKGVVKIENVID